MPEEIKLCKDCENCISSFEYQQGDTCLRRYYCKRRQFRNVDRVDGRVTITLSDCYEERSNDGQCGYSGKYWQPRPSLWQRIKLWLKGVK